MRKEFIPLAGKVIPEEKLVNIMGEFVSVIEKYKNKKMKN